MKLILLGAPGAGKGTQAERICEHYQIPAISTGNILREAIANGTQLGRRAKAFIDAGSLVPDDIIIGIIKARLQQPDCANGFVLDGFPRTIPQAEALAGMGVEIDKVLDIEVADEAVIERMSGRRVCPACGASYHTDHKPPQQDGVCDSCGAALIQRKDDAPETVRDRLMVYHEQTEPLKDYYAKTGKLRIVIGQDDVDHTTRLTFEALEEQA